MILLFSSHLTSTLLLCLPQKLKQEASDLKLSKKEIERRDRLRQEETKRELEKVKNRRIVRWRG